MLAQGPLRSTRSKVEDLVVVGIFLVQTGYEAIECWKQDFSGPRLEEVAAANVACFTGG